MVPLHIQLADSTLRRVIKRLHFPLEIMLVCVRWYAAYPLSLRNLEEMMAERGVLVDHATFTAGRCRCCRCWRRCSAGESNLLESPGGSTRPMCW